MHLFNRCSVPLLDQEVIPLSVSIQVLRDGHSNFASSRLWLDCCGIRDTAFGEEALGPTCW